MYPMCPQPSLAHEEGLPLRKGAPGQRRDTCAGVPILCQLVALATVALVGPIDVGALLAAALGLTLIHICGETGLWSGQSPPSRMARTKVSAYLEPYLGRPFVPASLKGRWGIRDLEKGKELGRAAEVGAGLELAGGVSACCPEEEATDWAQISPTGSLMLPY